MPQLASVSGSVTGNTVTVSIDSDWRLSGWPVSAERALNGNAPTTGIFLRDGRRSVVASAESLIYGWMADGSSFYSSRTDGEWAALPSRIRGAVLFADSIFKGSAPTHGAGVVATGMDGNVYAFRPQARTDATSSQLIGWPPVLDTNAPSVTATTAPVLASSAAVIVGGSDGRIFAITPQDSAVVPLVAAICDTLIVGGFPVVSDVSSNLAVGRFTGAGGYQVAYALRNGTVRVVDQASKDPGRFQAHWNAGAPGFEPYLLGVDMDRAADRNLELVVVDPLRRRVHCYNLAGAELPGWPVYVPAGLPGPVAAGDLDGDGYPEIFAVDAQGYAHRWNRNGVEGLGWPVSLTNRYGPGAVGGSDIYAQRIAHDGTAQWAVNGVPVCAAANVQSSPLMISDNAGGAIIAWLDLRANVIGDLYAQPQTLAANPVQLMTIHRAKGLEFDHVFVPSLDRVLNRGREPLLRWLDLPRAEEQIR